jgi:replicative DNA helicase
MISKRDVEGRIIASLLYGTKGLQGRIIRECEPCHFSLYKDKFEDAKKILVEYGCFTGPQQEILANGIQFRDGLDISDAIVNLKDMYIRESLKILSTQLVMAADSVEVELDQLHERFLELTSNYNPIIRMKSIRDVVPEVLSKTKELQNFPEVQWGYNRFSIMSLEPGTMVALCARPRVGKTAFGLNLAIRMAEAGDPVGFICIEMPNDQIATRIMCIKSHCRYQEIKDREFTDKDVALNFNSNIEKVKNLPIYLSCGIKYDTPRS